MVTIVMEGRIVQWNGPGLPTQPFQVGVRLGTAEYRPEPLTEANRQTRERIIGMLTRSGSRLASGLRRLIQTTSESGGLEYSGYIRSDGRITDVAEGDRNYAPGSQPPAGDVIGYVHTHGVPATVLAPPSAGDYNTSFQRCPIQLVAEMGGRIWAVFSGGLSSLLGRLNQRGQFNTLIDPSTRFAYRVYSADALRMEALDRERARAQAGQDRMTDVRGRIAAQRHQEAELRRQHLR